MGSKDTQLIWDGLFPNCPDSIDPLTDHEFLTLIPSGVRTTEHDNSSGKLVIRSRIEPWTNRLNNKDVYRQLCKEDRAKRKEEFARIRRYEHRIRTARVTNANLDADDLLSSARFIKKLFGPEIQS